MKLNRLQNFWPTCILKDTSILLQSLFLARMCAMLLQKLNHLKNVFSCCSAFVENSTKADSDPTGIFYFSQTALHIPIITLLKIKQDSDRLNHNNFEAMSKREFMSSVIDPFSANVVVALYEWVYLHFRFLVFFFFVEYISRISFRCAGVQLANDTG